jgi:hypothetical protein
MGSAEKEHWNEIPADATQSFQDIQRPELPEQDYEERDAGEEQSD